MVEFDTAIGTTDLTKASRLTQRHFVRDVRVFGLDLIVCLILLFWHYPIIQV